MKAVIYARYSSDNQREESIEGRSFLGKCWRNGLQRLQKIYSICSTDGS